MKNRTPPFPTESWESATILKPHRLTTRMIAVGYAQGIFPMGNDLDDTVDWFAAVSRCLLPITGIHLSRSMQKVIRKGGFDITFDRCFEEVMRCCRRPDGNWIIEPIIQVFKEVHLEGWGHSCEVWMDQELVGGVYGLAIGGCFCAESMFHRRTNASKLALWALVNHCREMGFTLFDAQIMNPHLQSLGAYEVSHDEYLKLLGAAQKVRTPWSLESRYF